MAYDRTNVFSRILKGELPAEKLYENAHAIVIKDKFPDAPVHNLVICRGEYSDLREFCSMATDEEKLAFFDALNSELQANEGGMKVLFNIGHDGGQVVFHLHAHVLAGDGLLDKHRTCHIAKFEKKDE